MGAFRIVEGQVLYRRWRSQTFSELVGQEHVTRLLLNALRQGRLAHAYLFCGPRGTGKTSTARILAKAANCETTGGRGEPCNACAVCRAINDGACLDVIEIDAASNRGIDDIRALRDSVGFAPSQGRRKFYIIDEAHQLTKPACDALLKTLEEPPAHVVFVLASTAPDSIPITIRSRCQRLDFRPIPQALVVERLALICEREGLAATREALHAIARASEGSLRDAESLLDQLAAAAPPEGLTVADVEAAIGRAAGGTALALVERLVERDAAGALRVVHDLTEQGFDATQFGRDVVRTLRGLLLVAVADDDSSLAELPPEDQDRARRLARVVRADTLVRWIRLFALAELPPRTLALPQLGIELACVEAVATVEPEAASATVGPTARPLGRPAPPASGLRAPLASEPPRAGGRIAGPGTGDADQPAAVAAPLTVSGGDLPVGADAEAVRRAWSRVLEAVGQRDRRAQAVLRDCTVVGGEQGRLVLGFRYDFHRDFFSDLKRRAMLEEAIARVCEERWRVECTRLDAASLAHRPTSALDDPLVREALATMGGRIKNVTRVEEAVEDPIAPSGEGDERA